MSTQLLRLDECAAIANVSIDTIRYWIRIGRVGSVRPGRRRLVPREHFLAFLMRGATGPLARGTESGNDKSDSIAGAEVSSTGTPNGDARGTAR